MADAWPNFFRMSRFLSAVDFVQADRLRRRVAAEMARVFAEVDLLLVPSLRDEMLTISNFTGHPSLTLRAGFVEVTQARSDWAPDPAHPLPTFSPPRRVPHGVTLIGPELRAQHRRSARSALAVAQSRRQRGNRAPAVVAELVQLVLPDDEPGPLEAVDPVARRMNGLLGEQLAGSGRHGDEQSRAHAAQLAQRCIEGVASLSGETVLGVVAPDMLERGDRDREVESTVLERQVAEVGLNARQPRHLGAHEVDAGQLGRAETEQPGEVRRLGERVADIEHTALPGVPRQAPGNVDGRSSDPGGAVMLRGRSPAAR